MTQQDTLGANVRAERGRKGWTQAELAERAGLSTAFISRLENGHTDTASANVRRLAEVLDVPAGELLGG